MTFTPEEQAIADSINGVTELAKEHGWQSDHGGSYASGRIALYLTPPSPNYIARLSEAMGIGVEASDDLSIKCGDNKEPVEAPTPEILFNGIWSEDTAQRLRQGILRFAGVEAPEEA